MEFRGVLNYFFLVSFISILALLVPSVKAPHDTGWACGGSTNYTCSGDTTCQNGYCAGSGSCGNHVCDSGETSSSCPGDCGSGTGTGTSCNYNNACDSSESCSSCPNDCCPGTGAGTGSCSTSNPSYCTSSSQCSSIGGSWCSNYCYYPASSAPSGCSTSTTTPNVCGNGNCESGETTGSCPSDCGTYIGTGSSSCSASNYWSCYSKTDCTNVGARWCDGSSGGSGWCTSSSSTCPTYVCSQSDYWNCFTKTDCTNVGAKWCEGSSGSNGYCNSVGYTCPSYTCSKSEYWNCNSETSCKGAGSYWCGSYCSSSECPKCSSSQTWNCYDETSCKSASGSWCKPTYSSGGSSTYTGYCQSSSCPSTSCDSGSPWNCYDETSCKSASGSWCTSTSSSGTSTAGSGWCQSGSCPTYSCSKSSTWYCYDETSCKGAGAYWCGNYCGSSQCPTCSSSQIWNCYDSSSCKTAGGNWCESTPTSTYSGSKTSTGYCQTSNCPSNKCDSASPWNCFDETSCKGSSGYWCSSNPSYPPVSNWCQGSSCTSYKCTLDSTWNCADKTSCESAGAQWCVSTYSGSSTGSGSGGWCQTNCPKCSSSSPWNCYDETSCKSASGYWCGSYCGSSQCPVCSLQNVGNCYDSSSCTKVSGKWCESTATYATSYSYSPPSSGWCTEYNCPSNKCELNNPWNCFDEVSCKGVGAKWCGNYCSSECPVCSSTQPWNCYSQSSCTSANGKWCGSYCSDKCPECSSTQKWNCYDKTSCSTASGQWCESYAIYAITASSTLAPIGYCSDNCPKCDSQNIWNCYTESSCTSANGKWCGSYCSSSECPKCSSSQSWNCYNKNDCTASGGQWCSTYCSSYKCPSICGNGVCESGEGSNYCSSDCKVSDCPVSITLDFDKPEYNVGDTLSMVINVGFGNIPVEIKGNVGTSGNTFSSLVNSDSSGKVTKSFVIKESTPGGSYNVEAKTNAPGCTSVSSQKSVKINSKGFCGDKACSSGESVLTCPSDCGTRTGDEGFCPSTKTCSDGTSVACGSYYGSCHCAPCALDSSTIPAGCVQESDSLTGVVRINCQTSCPPPPPGIENSKTKCINNGGNPTFNIDSRGCNYFNCDFSGGKDDFYTGPSRCFTDGELEETKLKCAKLGIPMKIKVFGDCKVAMCTDKEEATSCPLLLSNERKGLTAECSLQGLNSIKGYDEQGCPTLKCGTPDDCDKDLPEQAYDRCSREGGELIVKKDANDCITTVKCIRIHDEEDVSINDISILPERADLIATALKVVQAQIEIETLKEQAINIESYYSARASVNGDLWKRIVSSIDAIDQELENLKNDLRLVSEADEITKSDILTIKSGFKKLNIALENALYLMLSSSKEKIVTDTYETSDCGESDDCFNRALMLCKQASYSPDQNTIVSITGLKDDKCLLEAELDAEAGPPEGTIPGIGPPYTMTCEIKNYALGISDPEVDVFPSCQGSLLEVIKMYRTGSSEDLGVDSSKLTEEIDKAVEEERSYSPTGQVIMAFLDNNKGPRNCYGWTECTKICDREPFTCVGYIDSWLRNNPGPGGVRSLLDLNKFCSDNKQVCTEWMLAKGISLRDVSEAKKQSSSLLTSYAIRRV